MQTLINNNLQDLYEIDDSLWLEETIKILKEYRLNELDINNLIKELESLSRRDKAKVKSLLELVIIHLLLLQYWDTESERNKNHWQLEIDAFRRQLNYLMTKNLYNHLSENLEDMYAYAVKTVQKKTNYKLNNFPEFCCYTLDQLLDENCYSS